MPRYSFRKHTFVYLSVLFLALLLTQNLSDTTPAHAQTTPTPTPTPRPTPPPPGPGGQIVFARWTDDKQYELYVMNADGSYPATRITYNTEGNNDFMPPESDYPVWSPGNKKIAFRVASMNPAISGIYLINPDGTNQTKLTSGNAGDPTWSPDGKKIAFIGEFFTLYTVNADGTNQALIASSPRLQKGGTVWSPDGSKIAFHCVDLNNVEGTFEVCAISPDGTGLTNITNTPKIAELNPAWSPDGKLIAYTRWQGTDQEIWLMNADGSNQRSLPTRAFGRQPTWSTDGTKIAFIVGPSNNGQLYIMNADGSEQRPLLTPAGAFSRTELEDKFKAVTVDEAAQAQTDATTSASKDKSPNWQNELNLTPNMPASISATAGSGQGTPARSAYATPLQVTVRDGSYNPVGGVEVKFTSPANGASGTFAGNVTTATVTTDSSGKATAPVLTANETVGSFNVTASVSGGSPSTTFTLTNTKAQAQVTLGNLSQTYNGTPRSASVTTVPDGLAVTVTYNGSTTPPVNAGEYTVAVSVNDASYQGSAAGTLVIAQAASTTLVKSSVNPSDFGQGVTFTATVNADAGIPTGAVQFKDGDTNLGSPVAVNAGGVATFSTSELATGNHTITAHYTGDSNFAASMGTLTGGQVVNPQPSIALNDVSVTEGNAGTTNASFTVTLSRAGNLTVKVDFSTGSGTDTATGGTDYQSTTGTLTFNPGETSKSFTVTITGDTADEADETFTVNLTNPQNAAISKAIAVGTITDDDAPVVQLGSSNYQINEAANNTPQGFSALSVEVVRTGDTSAPASVQYFTSDQSGGNECNQVTTLASQRCDYSTAAGTLRFAPGEATKRIQVSVINDGYVEGNETFAIQLQNPAGATLGTNKEATITIQDSGIVTTSANNPYLSNELFVRMNYLDFLAREPDTEGFTGWTAVLNNCGPQQGFLGAPPACDRPHVSHGFFGAPEFINSGFLIYRMYEAGMNRLPRYAEFTPDMASLSGFGVPQSIQDQNLQDYLQQFTSKQEFQSRFANALQPAQAAALIQALEQTAGVTLPATATTLPGQPTQYGRQELINLRAAGTLTLGQTLKAFVEQKVIYDRYFARGQVTMLYFAYLKRDPDLNDAQLVGWTEWVKVFDNGGVRPDGVIIEPRDVHHLIFGFIYSAEYMKRFGQP